MSTNTNRIINADNIMYGDKKVNKVYLGDTPLWERTFIYGWHVNPNESDPDDAITYLNDAVDKSPAYMGSTTFDYGDWKNAFFIPKPCMLKSDGTVDYYLNKNDYSFINGVDIDSITVDAQLEMGGIDNRNGTNISTNGRVRTTGYIEIELGTTGFYASPKIIYNSPDNVASGVLAHTYIYQYNSNHGYLQMNSGLPTSLIEINPNTKYIRLTYGANAYAGVLSPAILGDAFVLSTVPCRTHIYDISYDGNAMMEWPKIWYRFCKPSDLGYRTVEYLQSTGTQIILTDVIGKNTYTYEMVLQIPENNTGDVNYRSLWGNLEFENGNVVARTGCNFGAPFSAHSTAFYLGTNTYTGVNYSASKFNTINTLIAGRPTVSYAGTSATYSEPITLREPRIPIAIFGDVRKEDDGDIYLGPYYITRRLRIFSFKIYDENNNLIHYFQPSERISDNVLGLLDIVTNKFYTNSGTGTFGKGSYIDDNEGYFYCSNNQVDSSYKCWCNYDYYGNQIDHFYTAIYNGTGTNKLRSLSGIYLTEANGSGNVATSTEIANAEANNVNSNKIWYIGQYSDRLLINSLLVLISKSLNTRAKFGNGLVGNDNTTIQNQKNGYQTGTLNDKGLFYGSTAVENEGMKVFGMENYWGCVFHRIAGLMVSTGSTDDYFLKLTRSTADGTTVSDYSFTDTTGYLVARNYAPTTAGNISKMRFLPSGYLPYDTSGGSISTYWCNWLAIFNNLSNNYALMGGMINNRAGAFEIDFTSATNAWTISSTLSCKPLYITQNEP